MNARAIAAGLLIAALGQSAPPLSDVVTMYREDSDLWAWAALPYGAMALILLWFFINE